MTHPEHSPLRDRAVAFRALHVPGRPLVLPNAWDTASARLVEDAGAAAVATTSAGLAWALGAADGDRLGREAALRAVADVVAAVRVPVTADVESGYATDPAGVADTVRAVLAAGAVGINIEDALHEGDAPLRPVAEQAERIAAARAAADAQGVPLFVNARIDTFLRGAGGVDLTLERAAAFVAAGADGVFVPGAVDPGTVRLLVEGVRAPLNVMAGPGAPPVAELAGLGVARVSVGSGIAQAAHALVRRAARELLDAGTYGSLAGGLDYGELNTLFAGGR
ncbi:isocitrate lyase/phosphoenolpyruvate mutase family protein [Streptomyces longwoodensis]|uniref:isocitrate lyase/PEP mutase family protein n=1 Tax=Streptomyces longwoodensis TaxID=68231 RepID=UPI0022570FC0|nr:isocitrate lyase/phosphoenolpyruvate mutase family protein [Streptomyces longwoodensis]MCX4997054.1 isocitrate lyase/phosphoenolpyruvate mutase family protein [Streptomyces longwoodensis]WRY91708.1 isocitrate lyase/phosphoenolpyruvate mutase family protein [Streptomyces longwoodensis]WTI44001.1 isocitrate lyase/phosphoenolpyruvate mutase family protein [Streptomyces longwoodensis]